MFVGATVHYSSIAGDFELTFPPDNPGGATPFSKGGETVVVSGNKISGNKTYGSKLLVLQNEGTFTCRCSLTLSASGEKLGWPTAGDQSGGNHVVRRT